MKSLVACCAVALALLVGTPVATAQQAPPPVSLPTVDPAVDPNAPPPDVPLMDDPSPQVALAMAKLHQLDMQHASAAAQAALEAAKADEARTQAAREAAQADRDAKHNVLAHAVTDAYVRSGTTTGDDVASMSADVLIGHVIDRNLERLDAAEAQLHVAESAYATAVKERTDAQAAFDGAQAALDEATLAVGEAARLTDKKDVSPSVLGDAVLTADEIVGWYRAQGVVGYVGKVDLTTMVGLYLDEGRAEHVRGDISFAQSIVETGAFTSPLTTHNNFAGIGACDSCATGFDFATPQDGVRAQAQLLHAYADKSLRPADFANPPVSIDLDTLPVRGCCTTWNKLTGTWASDPNYGPKLMTVYLSMLQFAYTERTKPPVAADPNV